jgi:glycosyltransferase involved in cell wall biosynthesis
MAVKKMIVIAWAERLDNAADFAKRVDRPFYSVYYHMFSDSRLLVPVRYFLQTLKTWQILLAQRPTLIHVTNPPIFATLNVFLYCKLFGAQYLLCVHPPSLYSRKWGWTVPMLRFFARHALINIIDQERFKALFESWKAEAVVLAKKPRSYVTSNIPPSTDGKYTITVVNTFAPDEPIEPILSAAKRLPDTHFYVLGNLDLANREMISNAPENVTFTGWLSHDLYWDQLNHSRAVMTLTTYPHSLLAGGTDGMAVGRPIILSRQPALIEYFNKGALFVENTPESLVDGIRQLQQEEDRLQKEILELAIEKRQLWEMNYQKLMSVIEKPTLGVLSPEI